MTGVFASLYTRRVAPWCRICRRPVWRCDRVSLTTEFGIEFRTICHGVPGRVRLDAEALELGRLPSGVLDVYELAPRALEPIRPEPPPRKRGRPLPPESEGILRILIPPPPDTVEAR